MEKMHGRLLIETRYAYNTSKVERMSKDSRSRKQHFELSPANRRGLEAYLDWYNGNPSRMTPKWKTGDVVNKALALWLAGHFADYASGEDRKDAQETGQG
jgi:hypothetical protein